MGLVVVVACSKAPPPSGDACAPGLASWPEADALFRNDPTWIGSDAAYSVDLGGGRVLWLFGDSFVAKDASRSRSNAWFVRNSVAIQSGSYDPSAAHATFFWKTTGTDATSFFPESVTHWFWPLSGVRLPTRLVLFLLEEESVTTGLGFQAVGTKVVFVPNPDDDPSAWILEDGNLPSFPFPIAFGAAVARDGPLVYAFGDEEPGDHSVYVARFDADALDAGDASSPLFFAGGAWSPASSAPPDVIFPGGENPPTELSVQRRADGAWLAIDSAGYGATQIWARTSPAPEGPWTAACPVFAPPENARSDAFEYAGKGHPELTGGSLVVTYATNATDSRDARDRHDALLPALRARAVTGQAHPRRSRRSWRFFTFA